MNIETIDHENNTVTIIQDQKTHTEYKKSLKSSGANDMLSRLYYFLDNKKNKNSWTYSHFKNQHSTMFDFDEISSYYFDCVMKFLAKEDDKDGN